jgi:nicotinate-nucleotide adenylyltransferase
MNIALFGGTFNPIHNGHLILANMCCSRYGMDKIIFLPSMNPVHKPSSVLAPARDRYRMTILAIQNNPLFEISPFDMYKQTYSYQTISYFKTLYPDDKIFFVVGADSFTQLGSWKKGFGLLDMCNFIVLKRPDVKIEKNEERRLKPAATKKYSDVIFADNPCIDISSTLIRKNIKKGKRIDDLVPRPVEIYIREKGLYK